MITTDVVTDSRNKSMQVHHSSKRQDWATPRHIFDECNRRFGFELDVCATVENAKCDRFFTEDDNGLAQEWTGVCWMNPPYNDIKRWIHKAYQSSLEGATVVCLVPARPGSKWWQIAERGEIELCRGRIKFEGADSPAPFPSAFVIFGEDYNKPLCQYCHEPFKPRRSDAKFCSVACKQAAYRERLDR